MLARANDPPPERRATAQIREQCARIEILMLDARGPPCSEGKDNMQGLRPFPGSEPTGDKQR